MDNCTPPAAPALTNPIWSASIRKIGSSSNAKSPPLDIPNISRTSQAFMQMIACHRSQLQGLKSAQIPAHKIGFKPALPILDALAGPQSFSRGAVHEVLAEANQTLPFFFATILAL